MSKRLPLASRGHRSGEMPFSYSWGVTYSPSPLEQRATQREEAFPRSGRARCAPRGVMHATPPPALGWWWLNTSIRLSLALASQCAGYGTGTAGALAWVRQGAVTSPRRPRAGLEQERREQHPPAPATQHRRGTCCAFSRRRGTAAGERLGHWGAAEDPSSLHRDGEHHRGDPTGPGEGHPRPALDPDPPTCAWKRL